MRYNAPGGNSNYFLMGCAARGLKPLPISKDTCISPSKMSDLTAFQNFHKSGSIFQVFFFVSKTADIAIFFAILVKWDPLLRIFLTEMRPLCKDFW